MREFIGDKNVVPFTCINLHRWQVARAYARLDGQPPKKKSGKNTDEM